MKSEINMRNRTDEQIKKMLTQLDDDVILNIEQPVMERVALEVDHSVEIAKIQRRIRIGMRLSIGLLLAFTAYTVFTVKGHNLDIGIDDNMYFMVSTLYSCIGLLLLFCLLEFRKRILLLQKISIIIKNN